MSWVFSGITAVVGTGLNVYGQIKKGQDEAAYYQAIAQQNEEQAQEDLKVAGENQSSLQDQAARESAALSREGKQLEGTQRATLAANGMGAGSTAEDIARDTFNREKMDQLLIRYNADAKTRSIAEEANFKASQLRSQGALYQQSAANAQTAGDLSGVASLLGSASQLGSQYARWKDYA